MNRLHSPPPDSRPGFAAHRAWPLLLVALLGLSACTVSSTRSTGPAANLEADTSSANWTEWRGTTVPSPIGDRQCYTTRQAILQGPHRIAIVIQRPSSGSCQFSSLRLLIGRENLPLNGLRGFKDVDDGKASNWAGNTGVLFFDATRVYSQEQLLSAALWEDGCPATGSCLTDSPRLRSKNPKPVPQQKINRGAPPMLPYPLYQKAFAMANQNQDAQQGFITLFTGADPDNLVPQVAARLRQDLLAKGDWKSLQTAWEQTPSKEVLQALSKEAKASAKAKELEAMVLAGLPASAVFEATPVSLKASQGKRSYESGKVDIQHYKKIFKGTSVIRLSPSSPIKLGQNKYSVTVTYVLTRDIEQFGAGWFTGDSRHDRTTAVSKTVELSPTNKYSAQVDVDFGELEIAYADRGTAGGYTRTRLAKEPTIEIKINAASQVTP